MNTAIIYYSKHHGNTKKLLDGIKAVDPSVVLIDVTAGGAADLSSYDRMWSSPWKTPPRSRRWR